MANGIAATPAMTRSAAIGMQPNDIANKVLRGAVRFWFLTAVAGQWIFATYIASFYGASALRGDFEAWGEVLPHGFIPGDTLGNFTIATHLLLTFIIIVGGPLQLLPQIRTRAPAFHRWNGRLYMLCAFVLAIGGLYMVWVRGAVGDLSQHIAISLNGILILLCAVMALRYAMARNIRTHRRWALRLFLTVSGVWFFRVGLMLWLLINRRPAGFDPQTFTGPFLTFLAFAQYLLPLAILQLYFHVQDTGAVARQSAMAGFLFILTVAMAAGIFAATMGMWLPRI